MKKQEVIEKLKDDEQYYGKFGKQYFSYSDINTLINNPEAYGAPSVNNINFVLGGYFHTCILEPHKLDKFKIIKSSSRNTNKYRELSDGEICMLEQEADMMQVLKQKVLDNDFICELIQDKDAEYEVPNIGEIEGKMFKCKADIVNHKHKLIIDLKTTGKSIDEFKYSARNFYYNSQAYIYSKIFGYDFAFVVVTKPTIKAYSEALQKGVDPTSLVKLGYFDCSDEFLSYGLDNIRQALDNYELYFNTPNFKPSNFIITKTL